MTASMFSKIINGGVRRFQKHQSKNESSNNNTKSRNSSNKNKERGIPARGNENAACFPLSTASLSIHDFDSIDTSLFEAMEQGWNERASRIHTSSNRNTTNEDHTFPIDDVNDSEENSKWGLDLTEYEDEEEEEDTNENAVTLGRRLLNVSKQMDQLVHGSNHVMVNQERFDHGMKSLSRCNELDELARSHAQIMAEKDLVFHCNHHDEIGEKFHHDNNEEEEEVINNKFGDNVAKGQNIGEIHNRMMKTEADRCNILDHEYTQMGMAIARGKNNGQIYLCQIYRAVVVTACQVAD